MAEIFFPLGRMIGGDVYTLYPRKDTNGAPKMRKDGTPDMRCSFGVAFQKTTARWQDEPWGQQVYAVGVAANPRESQFPAFAWKITDGDSTVPNKRGKIPAQLVGYAGHWVIWFSQGRCWLPKLLSADGAYELGPDMILPGYYVRVLADVTSNKSTSSPGVYINPKAVFLHYEGERIEVAKELDVSHLNLQQPVPMPPGARPVSQKMDGNFYGNAPAPAAPVAPADRGFLNVPPAPPAHQVTPAAGGISYEQFIAQGWTDEQLRANGYML